MTNPPVIRLRQIDGFAYLRSSLQYRYADDDRFPGERKVSTHDYAHTLGETPSLKPGLYSWEWAAREPRYPHVHVRRGHRDFAGLGKIHIPTGRVFFEDVVRFLIEEHEVEPVREDWRTILDECAHLVGSWATWGGRPPVPGGA